MAFRIAERFPPGAQKGTDSMTQPRRKSLSRQVMESIEQMILEQQLGPGDVLPTETQIADQLQVSKSSVREAVKMLEDFQV